MLAAKGAADEARFEVARRFTEVSRLLASHPLAQQLAGTSWAGRPASARFAPACTTGARHVSQPVTGLASCGGGCPHRWSATSALISWRARSARWTRTCVSAAPSGLAAAAKNAGWRRSTGSKPPWGGLCPALAWAAPAWAASLAEALPPSLQAISSAATSSSPAWSRTCSMRCRWPQLPCLFISRCTAQSTNRFFPPAACPPAADREAEGRRRSAAIPHGGLDPAAQGRGQRSRQHGGGGGGEQPRGVSRAPLGAAAGAVAVWGTRRTPTPPLRAVCPVLRACLLSGEQRSVHRLVPACFAVARC